jgi:S-adenosylmethionine hydrolase
VARPIIALITDFGLQDHYVGVMKGVALGICPDAVLVDITHDIPPQDVVAAALELDAAWRYFPAGTVFLVVVDPGVGTSRRAIAVAMHDRMFVAPDNGVLSIACDALADAHPLAAAEPASRRIVELTNPRYALPLVSRTFEGRDRFAPAAAWLAAGVDIGALGPAVPDLVVLDVRRPMVTSGGIDGEVVRVDRFGNLITNIPRSLYEQAAANARSSVDVAGRHVDGVRATYGEVPRGHLGALFGSAGRLEIAVRDGSAARELQAGRGTPVRVNIHRL